MYASPYPATHSLDFPMPGFVERSSGQEEDYSVINLAIEMVKIRLSTLVALWGGFFHQQTISNRHEEPVLHRIL